MTDIPPAVAAAIAAALAVVLEGEASSVDVRVRREGAPDDAWLLFGRHDMLRRPPERPR